MAQRPRQRPGQSFEDEAVARAYRHRPEYPDDLYRKLVEISPGRSRLLDLGCGPGKIARRLAPHFDSVVAVDPSAAMLRIARQLVSEEAERIEWVHGRAEEVPLAGEPFDLLVAGASIHWMDPGILFPRLSKLTRPDHVFAVVDGDAPAEPPWHPEWEAFLAYWIPELTGEAYAPGRRDSPYAKRMDRYRAWLDVTAEWTTRSAPLQQAVADFITCQHSRDTFAPFRLGARLGEFDEQLAGLLAPHARDGLLSFSIESTLVWGRIRS